MNRTASAVYAAVTAFLFLGMAGCGSGFGESTPASTEVSVSPSIAERWSKVSGYDQNLVCLQALERGGPDYQGMLRELMNAGLAQPDATVLLSYAVNQCQ